MKMKPTGPVGLLIAAIILASLCASSCTTTTTTATTTRSFRDRTEKPQGFFDRLSDAITERECHVGKFTCPYGLGPANEPCECVEPDGLVRKGTTIK